jgi:hypothetical protein
MKRNAYLMVLGLALVLLLPAVLRADGVGYQYDFSSAIPHETSNIVFTEPSLTASGMVTSFLSATDSTGVTISGFEWNSAAGGSCEGNRFTRKACAGYSFTDGLFATIFSFAPGSFLSPGRYTQSFATLTITHIPAAEPNSPSLLLAGTLGLGQLAGRKRLRA